MKRTRILGSSSTKIPSTYHMIACPLLWRPYSEKVAPCVARVGHGCQGLLRNSTCRGRVLSYGPSKVTYHDLSRGSTKVMVGGDIWQMCKGACANMTTDGNDGDGDGDHALHPHLPPNPTSAVCICASLCARSRTLHVLGGQKLSLVITLAFGNTSPSSHACEINYMQSSQLRDGKAKPWMAGRSLARYAP